MKVPLLDPSVKGVMLSAWTSAISCFLVRRYWNFCSVKKHFSDIDMEGREKEILTIKCKNHYGNLFQYIVYVYSVFLFSSKDILSSPWGFSLGCRYGESFKAVINTCFTSTNCSQHGTCFCQHNYSSLAVPEVQLTLTLNRVISLWRPPPPPPGYK